MLRWSLVGMAGVAIAIALLGARPVRTPGPLSRDFEAYWSAGSLWNERADPYGRAIWHAERGIEGVDARRDEILPFIGPPATLLAWGLFARLPYEQATHVWWIVLGISLLALVAAVLRAAGTQLAPLPFAAALVLAISFAPISSDLALGQLALPAFAGAALMTILADRSLTGATAAACLAFAQPNAAFGLVSQIGRNAQTCAIALGLLVTYGLGALASGWSWPPRYANAAIAHGGSERFTAIQFTPAAIAFDWGAPPRAAELIALAVAALAVGAAIALAVAVRDRLARLAAFSALTPFLSTFFHEHDFVVAYAAALWCALRTRARVRAIALAGTMLVGFDWLGLAQRPSGLAQCLLLALAALVAFAVLGDPSEIRMAFPAGIGMTALVVGVAVLAARTPVPVWPDPLVAFHAPPAAGIAAVWAAEQRASGLLAAVPSWGFLRSLSLAGCAFLAYAIYRHSSYCRTA